MHDNRVVPPVLAALAAVMFAVWMFAADAGVAADAIRIRLFYSTDFKGELEPCG